MSIGLLIPSLLGRRTPMHSTNISLITSTHTPSFGKSDIRPWKYQGYREFSKWMASDDDFFLLRKFESLNATTLVWLQYRISAQEERLEEIHKSVEESTDSDWQRNSSFAWDAVWMPERTKIMGELSDLLLQYNQSIHAFSKIRARPRAGARQIKNVVIRLKRELISPKESEFVERTADLMSINPRMIPPLGRWLESSRNLHLSKVFRAKFMPGLHVESPFTVYSSDEAFENFTTVSIIVSGVALLLAPLWCLDHVSTSKARLGVITGFLPVEVVATSAVYAAVLMVFMQIDGKDLS
ncbi:hypothetical protein CC80DRAFT_515725 [Byssothecium circinans]|uniref:DUF6594 domain-containing protein n=1 Tax=Byssothecium circinans TaxID=147558 RepID=A0A6A5TY65_9PLEO|nr:hypothetical protein CC80DRAFT_515725 [Byssothecium circinans]